MDYKISPIYISRERMGIAIAFFSVINDPFESEGKVTQMIIDSIVVGALLYWLYLWGSTVDNCLTLTFLRQVLRCAAHSGHQKPSAANCREAR